LPAHQFAKLCLAPPLALAQGTDVHADYGRLSLRDVVYAATPTRRHAPASFASTAKDRFPAVFRVPAPVNRQRLYDPEAPAPLTVG
jgi:hypothetical protein